jgi:hypothetical protein
MTIKMIIVFSRGTGESLFKLNFPHAGTGRCSFSQVRIGWTWTLRFTFHRYGSDGIGFGHWFFTGGK